MSEFYQQRRTSVKDGIGLIAFIAGWFGSAPFAWHHVAEGFDTGNPAYGVLKFLFVVFAAAVVAGGVGLLLGDGVGAAWERFHRHSRPAPRDEVTEQPSPALAPKVAQDATKVFRFDTEGVRADDVLRLSGLVGYAERDHARIAQALANSLLVGAWDNDILVGFARVLSDGHLSAALADVVVDPAYQRRGIGRALVRRAFDLTPRGTLLVVAGKASTRFFDGIGSERTGSGYVISRPVR